MLHYCSTCTKWVDEKYFDKQAQCCNECLQAKVTARAAQPDNQPQFEFTFSPGSFEQMLFGLGKDILMQGIGDLINHKRERKQQRKWDRKQRRGR